MYIKDYDFVMKNIDALFDKEIVMYGAKAMGKILARLLEDAHVGVDCFCDRDADIGCNLGGGITCYYTSGTEEQNKESRLHDYCCKRKISG